MTIEQKFHAVVALVEQVGTAAYEYFDADESRNELKADGSVVTRIDKAIEKEVVALVRTLFPEDTIIGEEGGSYEGTSGYVWHIDPIDGTDNFLRKIPFCAVSVARLGDTAEDSFGIVHNPITKQTYAALMDRGVYEREKVQVINTDILGGRAVVSIGRGRESWMKSAAYNLQKSLGIHFGKCSVYNCTSLELAYIAANRIDGFLIFGLHSWDFAAGLYLIKAAGGVVSVYDDGAWYEWTKSLKELCSRHDRIIFASHAGIHKDAVAHIGNPRAWSDEKES
jgi:myo-inositol-1(or 4)-monophosphatase